MWFRTLFGLLKSRGPRARTRRSAPKSAPPRAAGPRLRVELLDERCLPSTFTVTNLFDSGPGSLRASVAAANASPGPDTIEFATTGTITLTTGQLEISDGVTINGPGRGALTVSGNAASRVLGLTGSPTVLIAGLTIADGWTSGWPGGGGVSMFGGSLSLTDCAVTGNTATGEWYSEEGLGGGLSVLGGRLTLSGCSVTGNVASGATSDNGGWSGSGGGIYVQGGVEGCTVLLTGCEVSNNIAAGTSGQYFGGAGMGGGIYVGYSSYNETARSTVRIHQTTVANNLASGGNGGYGGSALGGGVCFAVGTLEVSQSTFTGNTAAGGQAGMGGHPGPSAGGGLYIDGWLPPSTYLDSFTVAHAVNNTPDDIVGSYILDGMPWLAIADVVAREGNGGTTAFVFTVTLSAASTEPVTVDYATANGTATAGSDYQATSGTLTFAPGETTKAITVLVNGDRLAEPNETFVVNLSSPTNATIADGQGAGTITDDEPRISISDVSKQEGKKGQTTLFTFTVTLSAAYDQPVTVSFQTVNGTATISDNDYVAKSGTLTFAPGETTKTVTIEVKGDSKREANETFYLDLPGLSGNAVFTKNRGVGTILNDD